MDLLREYVELQEAQSTVDMFWDALTALLEMADTSLDKVLVNTILDHTATRTLMTRSKMGLRSKLRGDARSKLIVLLRTINHVHDKLKKAGDVYVDRKESVREAKIDAKGSVEPDEVKAVDTSKTDDKSSKVMTPDELPRLIKQLILFSDPEDNKKLAKAVLAISPFKTLMTRARAVSMRMPSLVRHRLDDFQQSIDGKAKVE